MFEPGQYYHGCTTVGELANRSGQWCYGGCPGCGVRVEPWNWEFAFAGARHWIARGDRNAGAGAGAGGAVAILGQGRMLWGKGFGIELGRGSVPRAKGSAFP